MEYIGCFANRLTIVMHGPITEFQTNNSVEICVHTCIRKGRSKTIYNVGAKCIMLCTVKLNLSVKN